MKVLSGVARLVIRCGIFAWEGAYLLILIAVSIACRGLRKKVDVGIGPEPLINNVYHKRAVGFAGYSCETFVDTTWHITSDFDHLFVPTKKIASVYHSLFFPLFWFVARRYRIIYIYFNGGPLRKSRFLWRFEPFLLELAGVQVVVMPYGSDVQDLRSAPGYYFKACMIADYPRSYLRNARVAQQVDLWTQSSAFVLSGCDWVDYMYHWDKLMVSHFSIDATELSRSDGLDMGKSRYPEGFSEKRPMRLIHAPNHRSLKGTSHLIKAVEALRQEGCMIELKIIEKAANNDVIQAIKDADLVIDQLVVGWYAMFAIEAMALAKPVICYLREDLEDLYVACGLVAKGEIPVINATHNTVKQVIEALYFNPTRISHHGAQGPGFVERHHSLKRMGSEFQAINQALGVLPGCRS
jgi:hypothetical protein